MQNYTQSNLIQCDWADGDPFFALTLHFVASSIGPILAPLDSSVSHNFISLELVHVLQKQGTKTRVIGL